MAETTGYSSPLIFKRNIAPGVLHPFDGLPVEIVPRLNSGRGASGLTQIAHHFDNFTNYLGPAAEGTANSWVLSGARGTATTIINQNTAIVGRLDLVTSAADNDIAMLQYTGVHTRYATASDLWFSTEINVSTSQALLGELFWGATATNSDFVTAFPTAGFFFEKGPTATNLDFHVRNGGTSTENTEDFVGLDLTNSAGLTLVVRISGGNVTPYVYQSFTTGQADQWYVGTTVLAGDANMPSTSEDLFLHWGLQNAEAASHTMQLLRAFLARETT